MMTDGWKFIIGGDISQLQSQLAAARKTVTGHFDAIAGGVDMLNNKLGALGLGLSVTGFAAFFKGVVNGIDGLNDLADAAGTSVENVSALEDIAARTGTKFETVTGTLVRFNQALNSADPGSTTSKALRAINLSADELRKIDPAEALMQTAKALSNYADDGNKARLVQLLFGKSVAEVAPLLKDLADKGELNATVTGQQAAEAEKFNKELFQLEKNSKDAARALVSDMLPALNAILEKYRTGGLIAGLDEMGNRLFDWQGNAERKHIQNLKSELASLQEESTSITFDAFGVKGKIDARIKDVTAQIDAATKAYYKLNDAAGGGRGFVNPANADGRQGVGVVDTSKTTKETLSDYDKLAKKLSEDIAKATAEAEGAQRGYNKAQVEFLALQNSPDWAKFTATQRADIQALYEKKGAAEQALDAAKAEIKAAQEAAKARQELRRKEADSIADWMAAEQQSAHQSAQSVLDRVRDLEAEGQAAALAREKNISLAEAVEMVTLARLRERQQGFYEGSEGWQAIQREIDAREQLLHGLGDKSAREKLERDWEQTSKTIGDTLSDYIMGGGKDAATYLKRLFSTLVLQPVVQYGVNGLMSMLGMAPSVSGAASGGLSVLGGGSNLLGTAGSGLGLFGGSFGMGLNAGFAGLFGEAGLMGTLDAGAVALGVGNILGGLGTFVGALGPIVLGLGALTSIIGKLDKSGTPHWGAGATYEGGQITHTGADNYWQDYYGIGASHQWKQNVQDFVNPVAQGVGSVLDGIAQAFGQQGGYSVRTAYADDSSSDGAHGALRITDASGKDLVNWEDLRTSKWAPRIFSDGEEGQKEYLAAIAKDTRQVLLDMDLPSWADTILESIGDAADMTGLSNAVAQISKINTVFTQLSATLDGFASVTDDARAAIMNAAGGIDALAASANTYYENFYTPEERQQKTRDMISGKLGDLGIDNFDFSAPDARERYRALVEDRMRAANDEAARATTLRAGLDGGIAGMSADDFTTWALDARQQYAAALGSTGNMATQEERDRLNAAFSGFSAGTLSIEGLSDAVQAFALPAGAAGKSAAEAAAELLDLSGAVASVTTSAEDAAAAAKQLADEQERAHKALIDSTYDLFKRAVDAQKTTLQDQASAISDVIGTIGSAVDMLKSNARDLYGTVDSTAQMLAAQGMVYIEDALAGVHGGKSIADYTGLSDAVTAARGGLGSGAYATEFDRQRDTLVLAGQLSDLAEAGGEQLTVEQRQLKALNDQLDYLDTLAKRADDLVNGTAALTDTVDGYFKQLMALLGVEDATDGAGGTGKGGTGGAVWGPGSTGFGPAAEAKYKTPTFAGSGYGTVYAYATDPDYVAHLDKLAPIVDSYSGTGDVAGMAAAVKAAGGTEKDLAYLYGFSEADINRELDKLGIPRFDVGINRVPFDMTAQIHKDEAVVPARFNPFNPGAQQWGVGSSDAVLSELRALREEVAQLRQANQATASNTAGLPQLVEQFDDVTEGGNAMRERAMA